MQIEAFRLPRSREIPDVGLYLEQAVKYVNSFLSPLDIPVLTGSMIANYVKLRYLPAPHRKLYGAEQLASLLMVAICKQVLSMDNISRLLSLQQAAKPLMDAYDDFCTGMEAEIAATFGLPAPKADPIERADEGWQLMQGVMTAAARVIQVNSRFAALQSEG